MHVGFLPSYYHVVCFRFSSPNPMTLFIYLFILCFHVFFPLCSFINLSFDRCFSQRLSLSLSLCERSLIICRLQQYLSHPSLVFDSVTTTTLLLRYVPSLKPIFPLLLLSSYNDHLVFFPF
jgi:hypothetical protein